jgi:hypothetical protein
MPGGRPPDQETLLYFDKVTDYATNKVYGVCKACGFRRQWHTSQLKKHHDMRCEGVSNQNQNRNQNDEANNSAVDISMPGSNTAQVAGQDL